MRRPTLIDVAREAGVSRATASRVLAGSSNVDQRMTEAVNGAARALGYQANAAARSLATGRAGSVGLIVAGNQLEGLSDWFIAAPLRGATAVLSESQLQPVLLLADRNHIERLTSYLNGGHIDGAVVILQHEIVDFVGFFKSVVVPLVYIGRPAGAGALGLNFVDSDNYGGGRIATRALLDGGRRRIATISGPADMRAAVDRQIGWRDELAEQNIAPGPVAHGDFTMQGGAAAMARLLSRSPDLDAVFAASDLMAVGALRVLEASGRSVPADVSVVGFDDSVVAFTAVPPLTSIRQPLEEMGHAAAELLLSVIEDDSTARQRILPTALVVRESI